MELTTAGTCRHCGTAVGDRSWFCSPRCRKRAFRRRRAGVPENAHPGTGRRGRVPLGEATASELAWLAIRAELEARRTGAPSDF